MIIQTFHGSLDRSIDRFRIATHFGNREQALSAIGAKRFLDGVESGLPTLYEVIIDIKDSLLHKVDKDWGSPGAAGALLPIRNFLKQELSDENSIFKITKRFKEHFEKIKSISCSNKAAIEAETLLLSEANGRFAVLEYNNSVEANGSGYCVLDPSRITLIAITCPDWNEVLQAFKAHNDYSQATSEVEKFKSALDFRCK